eukprot:TRINITY_DN46882_c0_g1_i1.p1 TRINITY_DN46882_c0_g1~~TRINITY_DN46882_c0_g1_i1.p1  ORF type:complete len:225 (-),score=12.36 TRINITY_DN46882_c0_g1_i1:390-1064(-)
MRGRTKGCRQSKQQGKAQNTKISDKRGKRKKIDVTPPSSPRVTPKKRRKSKDAFETPNEKSPPQTHTPTPSPTFAALETPQKGCTKTRKQPEPKSKCTKTPRKSVAKPSAKTKTITTESLSTSQSTQAASSHKPRRRLQPVVRGDNWAPWCHTGLSSSVITTVETVHECLWQPTWRRKDDSTQPQELPNPFRPASPIKLLPFYRCTSSQSQDSNTQNTSFTDSQ